MKLLRPIPIIRATRPGRKGGVNRQFLTGGGSRQQPQQQADILQSRNHLFDTGQGDMHPGQNLGQIAVAFISDDDRRSGFGDAEIGPGNADIGL